MQHFNGLMLTKDSIEKYRVDMKRPVEIKDGAFNQMPPQISSSIRSDAAQTHRTDGSPQ